MIKVEFNEKSKRHEFTFKNFSVWIFGDESGGILKDNKSADTIKIDVDDLNFIFNWDVNQITYQELVDNLVDG